MAPPKARSWRAQALTLGVEAVPGVAVPGTRRLGGMRLDPGFEVAAETVGAGGAIVPTAVLVNSEVAAWEVSGFNTYHDLCYAITSLLGPATIINLGGTPPAFRWVWLPKARKAPVPQTFTAYWGDDWQMARAAHLYFNAWNIDVTRGALGFGAEARSYPLEYGVVPPTSEVQRITITGSPTGGTFTLTVPANAKGGPATTVAINHNATAADIRAALEALANIDAGDVLCLGGPFPATPVDVAWAGDFGATDMPTLTAAAALTGGTTPAVAITTPTAANTPTNVDPVVIQPKAFDTYMDPTWAALGTSKLLAAYQMNPGFEGMYAEGWTINSANAGFDNIVIAEEPGFPVTAQVALDDVGVGLLQNTFRAGARKFFRLRQEGDVISGANRYLFQFDWCMMILEPNVESRDGIAVATLGGTMAEDPVSGNYSQIEIVNGLAGL